MRVMPGSSHARSLPIVDLAVDPVSARIYEHGWQSWSPAITYALGDAPHRAATPDTHVMNCRPGRIPDVGTFRGEGLLAVSADGPVDHVVDGGPGRIDGALARWAEAQPGGVPGGRPSVRVEAGAAGSSTWWRTSSVTTGAVAQAGVRRR
jgi:hypothetical protein